MVLTSSTDGITGGRCRYGRALIHGAIFAMGARFSSLPTSISALAFEFQLPCARRAGQPRFTSQRCPPIYPRPQSRQTVGKTASIPRTYSRLASSLQQHVTTTTTSTGTGWINSDTLELRASASNVSPNSTENDVHKVKFNDHKDEDVKVRYPSPSTVERLLIRDRLALIKRDDALHLPSSNISGNKARKFLSLNNIPANEFPEAIVSYGGPQSNAMVALAAIVSSKNAELEGREPSLAGENDADWELQKQHLESDEFWQLDVSEEDVSSNNGEKEEGNSQSKIQSKKKKSSPSSSSPSTKAIQKSNKKLRFVYYTKTLPRYLRQNPNGNLLRALALGMEIRALSHEEYRRLFGGLNGGSVLAPADLDPPLPGRSLWIPQGGACGVARPGSEALAREIVDYWAVRGNGAPLAACVPGGTCTTALLLHRSVNALLEERRREGNEPMDVRVVVVPCVGDDEYARRQMSSLDRSAGGRGRPEDLPFVLRPRSDVEYGSARRRSGGYFRFGEPAKAILETYDEMNGCGLFLDLLYGAPAWSLLLQHWKSRDADCPIAGRQVMYIHSGGLEGIASQLTRYKHKGLIDARTIQIS